MGLDRVQRVVLARRLGYSPSRVTRWFGDGATGSRAPARRILALALQDAWHPHTHEPTIAQFGSEKQRGFNPDPLMSPVAWWTDSGARGLRRILEQKSEGANQGATKFTVQTLDSKIPWDMLTEATLSHPPAVQKTVRVSIDRLAFVFDVPIQKRGEFEAFVEQSTKPKMPQAGVYRPFRRERSLPGRMGHISFFIVGGR